MQTRYKSLLAVAVTLSLGFFLPACNKPAYITVKQEGTVYMPQAFSTRGQLSILWEDSTQSVVFGAAYGGLKYPSTAINATFIVDTNAVAAYNLQNGTSFVPFPVGTYTVPTLTTTISPGSTSSAPLTVSFNTISLNSSKQYMLPITMTNISSGIFDSSLSTTYFTFTNFVNLYDGSYTTTGTRTNYNADGTVSGTDPISDTRVLTTMFSDSCSINTIANLGVYAGTQFYIRINPDNTCEFSGELGATTPLSPIANQPGKVSTYNPATKTFTVHYMYTNTSGSYRYMDEVWTPQ